MYRCIVCGKEVKDDEDFDWFGLDGDKIHTNCKKDLDKTYDSFNNMTNEEFRKYLLGE